MAYPLATTSHRLLAAVWASTISCPQPERWYSWDVTQTVGRLEKRGTVSYALGLRTVEEKKEEQVLLVSQEVGRFASRLVVTYTRRQSAIAWYPWAGGIVGAAVLAFVVGWWLARRRRSVTGA